MNMNFEVENMVLSSVTLLITSNPSAGASVADAEWRAMHEKELGGFNVPCLEMFSKVCRAARSCFQENLCKLDKVLYL